MKIKTEEITSVIKTEIEQYANQLEVSDVGRVIEVGDDAAWQRAVPMTGFTQREPSDGQPASERTERMTPTKYCRVARRPTS